MNLVCRLMGLMPKSLILIKFFKIPWIDNLRRLQGALNIEFRVHQEIISKIVERQRIA